MTRKPDELLQEAIEHLEKAKKHLENYRQSEAKRSMKNASDYINQMDWHFEDERRKNVIHT